MERWLNDGAHALRSLFSLAQQYRYSGTTRDDFAAKNAAARAALEKFGELPQDVLEGTRRSRFAPPIARRTTKPGTPPAAPAIEPDAPASRMAQPMVRRAMRVRAHDGIAPISHSTRFVALEQADFQRLEHAGYLKGLYSLLRVRGSLETWASQCACAARRRDWPGAAARAAPGARLSLQSARRATGPAGHWRRDDLPALAQPRPFLHGRGVVGGPARPPATPASLIDELYAIELQRIVLNMQISLTHSIARQALECANKAAQAEAAYLRRVHGHTASVPPTTKESP